MKDPLSLGFVAVLHETSLAVRITPDAFDSLDDKHQRLFQKCVGIIDAMRNGPVSKKLPKQQRSYPLSIRNLRFWRNASAADRQDWESLWLVWNGAKK